MKLIHILFIALLCCILHSCKSDFTCPTIDLNVGDACNDGNLGTDNDIVNADCTCTGTPIPEYCQDLNLIIGDSCDDENLGTDMDTVTVNCLCIGTPIPNYCPNLELIIGDDCDDNDLSTENDIVNNACECVGTPNPDYCPNLELIIGDSCDDNDNSTVDDAVTLICTCEGLPPTPPPTYSNTIEAILSTNCSTSPACHGANSNTTFAMSTYSETINAYGFIDLLGAIKHAEGYSPMPKDGPKLSQQEIDDFRAWIIAFVPR